MFCKPLKTNELAILSHPLAMMPTMHDNTWLSILDSKEGSGTYGDTN